MENLGEFVLSESESGNGSPEISHQTLNKQIDKSAHSIEVEKQSFSNRDDEYHDQLYNKKMSRNYDRTEVIYKKRIKTVSLLQLTFGLLGIVVSVSLEVFFNRVMSEGGLFGSMWCFIMGFRSYRANTNELRLKVVLPCEILSGCGGIMIALIGIIRIVAMANKGDTSVGDYGCRAILVLIGLVEIILCVIASTTYVQARNFSRKIQDISKLEVFTDKQQPAIIEDTMEDV